MGIIKKSLSAKPDRGAVTIIAEGNKFCGDITAVGRLHIDGFFEGSIVSSHEVSVGKLGTVTGTVKAPNVNISGQLDGEVNCHELHIESGGEVHGTVISNKLSIDDDGVFVGERKTVEAVICAEPLGRVGTDFEEDLLASLPDKIMLTKDES